MAVNAPIVLDVGNPFFTDVARGVEDEVSKSGLAPLSSVRQPRQLIGRTAAQLLLEEAMGSGGHQHRQVIFEPELEIRRSSQGGPRPSRRRSPAATVLPG
jgi:DNA-binding LacI/PurR family transcriptional regulator